jgi:ketosteroid isomerase-like protein
MRYLIAVAVCALASVPVIAQCDSTEMAQIEAVGNSWQTSWNASDLNKVMELYSDDAVFLPSDGTRVTGKTEIKDALQKQIGSTVAITRVTVACSGDFAYNSGTYTQDFSAGVRKSKHIEGQYLVVLKHAKGGAIMGGNSMIGGNAVLGGGGGWVIVQHAATAKQQAGSAL